MEIQIIYKYAERLTRHVQIIIGPNLLKNPLGTVIKEIKRSSITKMFHNIRSVTVERHKLNCRL